MSKHRTQIPTPAPPSPSGLQKQDKANNEEKGVQVHVPLKKCDGLRGLLPAGPGGNEGCVEGRVGRFKAVVRAMSFRACSADVELLLALANCRHTVHSEAQVCARGREKPVPFGN